MKKNAGVPLVNRIVRMASLIVTVLLLVYCAGTLASFMDSDSFWVRWGLCLWMILPERVAEYLMLLVHEAGHMVGGWLSGQKLSGISVAGWTLVRRSGKLRWGYEATPGVGGLCSMATDRTPAPFFIHILAGPMATILLGGVCAWLAVRTYPAYDLYWDEALRLALMHIPLTILAVVGIRSGVVNLIPLRSTAALNDGMQLWLLSRDGRCRAAREQAGRVAWEEYRGRLLADMPEELFAHPPIARDMNPYAAGLAVLRLARLLGQRDYASALALCHELLDAEVALEALQLMCVVRTGAVCEAMLGNPGPLCRRMQDKDMVRLMQFTRCTRGTILTWYAMAKLVSRDEQAAGLHREAYARAAARSPYHESVRSDEAFMALVDETAAAQAEGHVEEREGA